MLFKKDINIVNIEEDMPATADAMEQLKFMIGLCRQNKIHCLVIIHGYGSHGVGGIIRIKARQWLNAQKRKGALKEVINGEDFNFGNGRALVLNDKYWELSGYLGNFNQGITIIEL